MAKDIRFGIRLAADGKGFVGEVRLAKQGLDNLTGHTPQRSFLSGSA